MIEIIKEGQPKFDITCEHCDSVLRFQIEDVRRWYDKPSGWGGYEIKCPVCGKSVEIGCSHSCYETLKMLDSKIKPL